MNVARLLAVLAAACTLLALAVFTVPADAARTPAVTAGSRYLALGDSVTFGYEESAVVPAPNYKDAASFIAYPQLVGEVLHLKVANASCPGETTGSLIDASAESNGCENILGKGGGYRTAYPLHVRYRGSQLAYAVSYLRRHRDVRLVSLMIGANDAFICQETTKDACLAPSEQRAVFAKIARNVRRILSAIRNQARYRGQIVIVNYWSLDYSSSVVTGVTRGLNAAVDGAARRYGVRFADGFGEFRQGTRIFGGNPCTAGLLTKLSTGGCGV